MTSFQGLGLAPTLLRAVAAQNHTAPTPIQAQAIPPLLTGRDLLGIAQTGTGKTAAFALPLLHKLGETGTKARPGHPRALILSPTRELAQQIADSAEAYARFDRIRLAAVFGGMSIRPQIQALRRGVHVLVATPGRLMDLMNQGHLRWTPSRCSSSTRPTACSTWASSTTCAIAAKLPNGARRPCFPPPCRTPSQALADGLLTDPVRVEVTPGRHHGGAWWSSGCCSWTKDKKRALIAELLAEAASSGC
jgi:ATP-dependent RNA helicase RhlE